MRDLAYGLIDHEATHTPEAQQEDEEGRQQHYEEEEDDDDDEHREARERERQLALNKSLALKVRSRWPQRLSRAWSHCGRQADHGCCLWWPGRGPPVGQHRRAPT